MLPCQKMAALHLHSICLATLSCGRPVKPDGRPISFDSGAGSLLQLIETCQWTTRTRVSARKTTDSKHTRLFAWYACLSASHGRVLRRSAKSRASNNSEELFACCTGPKFLWPSDPSQLRAQLCFPRFQISPPRERGAAARWRGGAHCLWIPTADSKTVVLAGTSARVSAFGTSWSQRWRPSLLDQTNQTRTRWGVAFCAWTNCVVQCAFSPGCRFGRLWAGLDVTQALGRRMTRSQLAQKLTSVHPACRGPRGGLAIWGTWEAQPSRGLTMSRAFG